MKLCSQCGTSKSLASFYKRYGKPRPECKECSDKTNANYIKKNVEKVAEIKKKSAGHTKSARGLSGKKWRQANPGKVNAKTAKRRAAKLNAIPDCLSDANLAEMKELYILAKELSWLSDGGLEVDHIVPLQGKEVSGLHVPWNLQIIPAFENGSKGNKFIL